MKSRGLDQGSTFYFSIPVSQISTSSTANNKSSMSSALINPEMRVAKRTNARPVSSASSASQVMPELSQNDISNNNIHSESSVALRVTDIRSAEPVIPSLNANFSTVNPDAKVDKTNNIYITSLKVLVVDDVASNRKMVIRTLEANKMTTSIDQAADGQEALDLVLDMIKKEVTYDLIIMDFEMPVLNGPDATKKARGAGYKGLIFGLTGNAQDVDIAHFKTSGADEVMVTTHIYDHAARRRSYEILAEVAGLAGGVRAVGHGVIRWNVSLAISACRRSRYVTVQVAPSSRT